MHLAWHPTTDDVLAATVRGGVLLVEIARMRAAGGNEAVACEPAALPEGILVRRMGSARTACVAFSPDGARLAAGGCNGKVGIRSHQKNLDPAYIYCRRGVPHACCTHPCAVPPLQKHTPYPAYMDCRQGILKAFACMPVPCRQSCQLRPPWCAAWLPHTPVLLVCLSGVTPSGPVRAHAGARVGRARADCGGPAGAAGGAAGGAGALRRARRR